MARRWRICAAVIERNKTIMEDRRNGATGEAIARKYRLTIRQVWRILRGGHGQAYRGEDNADASSYGMQYNGTHERKLLL